jgi:hypothetical protein
LRDAETTIRQLLLALPDDDTSNSPASCRVASRNYVTGCLTNDVTGCSGNDAFRKRSPMLTQPLLQQLHALRLRGMAAGLEQQLSGTASGDLSFEERLGLLIQQ